MGQYGATSRIEKRIVFENANSRRDGIEAATASLEYRITCIERLREPRAVTGAIIGAELLACDHARTAVDGDRERTFGFGGSGVCRKD